MARIIGRLPSGRNRRIYGQHYMKDLPDQEPMFGSTRRTVAKKTAKKSAGQPGKMAHTISAPLDPKSRVRLRRLIYCI